MSDLNTAPGEQPTPETAPAPIAGEQPQATDHSATLETLDQSQLGDLLFGEKKEIQEPPVTTPPAPAAGTPAETPTAGEQPQGEKTPETDKGEESSLRRLALGGVPLSERQQMADVAAMIRRGEATSQVDALQKMGVIPGAAPASEPPAADAPAAPAATATETPAAVTELEATIADLRAQRDQADDDYDKPEARRLTALIEDTVGLLAQARIAAVSQQSVASTYQHEYLSVVDAMEEKHAWATDETSPLYRLLDDRVTAAQARNDEALKDPNFIMKFADEVAEYAKPAAMAKPPAPPAQEPRVIGAGVAPGHSEAARLTPLEEKALVQNATKEQLAAALFG